jgi:hypothetical protein
METSRGEEVMTETLEAWSDQPRRARIRDLAGLGTAWAVWGAMTVRLLLFVQQYSGNVPFIDDFNMVPILTGSVPVTLDWAWSQHHEHRPMISRLILVGLSRFVSRDFRTARYANVGLISAMAAGMLLLARSLRSSARLTDAVLPLSILTVAQAETLMIGFAMNLVLTSFIAIVLILGAGAGRRWDGRGMALIFGLALVLLPLCGGSGLAMLPPLALWVAGYVTRGWWSGREPGALVRSIGLGSLLACSAMVALYLHGYTQPPYHPLSSSPRTVAIGAVKFLSLGVYPNVRKYWWPAGLILVMILTSTVLLLARVAWRTHSERPRAMALMAILFSLFSLAGAVGVSRAGLGPDVPLLSRYVTLTIPLLSALYIAWLAYGHATAQMGVHLVLFALIVSTLPTSHRFSRKYGGAVRVAVQRLERGLKDHVPTEKLMSLACPAIYPDPQFAQTCFRMLKGARIGAFVNFDDDRVASTPDAAGAIRR